MADKIFIKNLSVSSRVGIAESERKRRQSVIVDVCIFLDLREAGISDDLKKTLSYSEISKNILDFASKGEFKLLESVAEGIASLLLQNDDATRVKVRVRKKKYATQPSIGIEITRTRHG